MNVIGTCPHCGAQLEATPAQMGWKLPCPKCGEEVSVPSARSLPPPPPPEPPPVIQPRKADHADHPLLLLPSHGKHAEDLIDMTAMVDIVFFLLIFFLVTSMAAIEAVINLPPVQPSDSGAGKVAAADAARDTANYITVIIDDQNAVWLDGEEVLGDQNLRIKLRAAKGSDRRGLLVIGSADATHGALVTVIDAGADAGIEELLFSVKDQVDADDG
jgi:biopolymer transport protein ExbD